MSDKVVLIVLFAALLHAVWNALIKAGSDRYLNMVLVVCGAGAISAVLLPFFAQPAAASWPYIAASAVIQVVYYILLAAVYRTGDFSHAYPLMRGTAPLFVALVSVILLGEHLPVSVWIGVASICAGILALTFNGQPHGAPNRMTVVLALSNAAMIAAYTLVDGVGIRKSGARMGYILWVFLLPALPLFVWTMLYRSRDVMSHVRANLHVALIGGAGTLGSYGLALWAMTLAPIALVAALRETSILFATLIAVLFLKERFGWRRYVAIAFIAAGAVAIRLL